MTSRRTAEQPPLIQGACWACGLFRWTTAGYCTPCTLAGLNSPWMNCSECGSVRRRQVPGQQHFTCQRCTTEGTP